MARLRCCAPEGSARTAPAVARGRSTLNCSWGTRTTRRQVRFGGTSHKLYGAVDELHKLRLVELLQAVAQPLATLQVLWLSLRYC